MNVFSRSWELTKLTFGVIKQDKELLLFPILSSIFSVILLIALLFPTVITGLLLGGDESANVIWYAAMFAAYFAVTFVATFFNVCVAYTAKTRFEGGNATFGQSIGFAFSRLHRIFAWSLVSATVGVLLSMLERAARQSRGGMGLVLSIVRGMLGMAWSVVTVFVIPIMVYEDVGPIDSIKRSVSLLKKSWGESLVRYYGMGFVQAGLTILGLIIGIGLAILMLQISIVAFVIAVCVTVLYVVIISLLFSVANQVYNTAIYAYASSGKMPKGFSEEYVKHAFEKTKSQ